MPIKIIEDKELWDDFIDKSNQGMLFHRWNFLKIVEKHTKCRFLPYGIYIKNDLIGVFPVFYKRVWVLKTVFSPPPNTGIPYLGPLMSLEYDTLKQNTKEHLLNTLVNEVDEEIRRLSPNYVSILLTTNFKDTRPFKWNKYYAEPYYTYFIDLNNSLEDICSLLKKKCRDQIKSTEGKASLKKSTDVNEFYKLLENRYREQKMKCPISLPYLKEVFNEFCDNISIYYAYSEDDIIAIEMTIEYKERYMNWMGSVKPKIKIYGNEYLKWELLKIAKSKGYKKYELTGANTKQLCLFKSKFNPQLEVYFKVYKKDIVGELAESIYLKFKKR